MGQEAVCRARVDGADAEGKALLETEEIIFRGPPRLALRFRDITGIDVRGATLELRGDGRLLELELGAQAERWAEKIRNPRTLADKLGVKPGMDIRAIGVVDAAALAEIEARGGRITPDWPEAACDMVLLAIDEPVHLPALERARGAIKKDGAVWAVHPKGRKDLRDVDVMAAGKAALLVDNKVVKFSESHSALRFVIPRSMR
ncbi:MAG: hypothetical protein U0821_24200 [Chloroflexota bacterium]